MSGEDAAGSIWSHEGTRRRQRRLGLKLTPRQRLRWLEETMDELRPLAGRARGAESKDRVRRGTGDESARPAPTVGVSITRRPIRPEDHDFLYRLYASTRAEEMALLEWSDDEKKRFLRFQFEAQHKYYTEQFPDARFELVLGGDGEPIGRLYVDRRTDEIRLIDIALLPEQRGRGIGGALMREILDEARSKGLPVQIHVERNNPALRLYHRLGFREVEEQGVYYLMRWTPPAW